ncbi:MAG: ferritin [Tissierellia bacterium]|nr:ferritin [Bacillota bacterium]NLL22754.1 ferritin [Tissierellia bacterium]
MTKMMKALNEQINKEIYSGYLYLSMVNYFEERSLDGFASWFKAQAQEELYHAMRIYNFIHEVGGKVVLEAIEKPDIEWTSPLQVFQEGLKHEKFITASIHELVQMAEEEKEYAVRDMLQWFIVEQVEEEANFSLHVDQLELGGDTGAALMLMNSKMAARVPLPLSADEQTE